MDLNKSIELNHPSSSAASPQPEEHNLMPISILNSSMLLDYHRRRKQEYEQAYHSRFMQAQRQQLDIFWTRQFLDIKNSSEFKSHHQLPLARIKRIMKSDRQAKIISADTPILFAKACELFIMELTLRSWLQTEECKRRTLQRSDIARAMRLDSILGFLVKAVPYDHFNFNKDLVILNEHKEIEKCDEEIELQPEAQVPFPMIDINEAFVLTNDEIPPEFIISPAIPSSEFSHEYDPK